MDLLSNTQKFLKKLLNIWNNNITADSDHAAMRVSVMQWRLEVKLPTVQHKQEVSWNS